MKKVVAVAGLLLLMTIPTLAVCETVGSSSVDERTEHQEAFGMGTRAGLPVQETIEEKVQVTNTSVSAKDVVEAEIEPVVRVEAGTASANKKAALADKTTSQTRRAAKKQEPAATARVVVREVTGTSTHQLSDKTSPSLDDSITPVEAAANVSPKSSRRPDKVAMISYAKQDSKPAKEENGLSAGTIFRTVFNLAIVLGLAYLTILILKWFSNRKGIAPHQASNSLRVMDTLRLSPTNTLHIVNAKGKTLLIGCSSGQVNLLEEFDEDVEDESIDLPANGRFAEYLAKYSEASGHKTPASRIAGALRDCTEYLNKRNPGAAKSRVGGKDEE